MNRINNNDFEGLVGIVNSKEVCRLSFYYYYYYIFWLNLKEELHSRERMSQQLRNVRNWDEGENEAKRDEKKRRRMRENVLLPLSLSRPMNSIVRKERKEKRKKI